LYSQPSTEHAGFRYGSPDIRHFCLLKIIRAISAFNAALELCELGYPQEICVLLRTIVECTSHVDYVLAADVSPAGVTRFIEHYFSDAHRGKTQESKRSILRQGEVHNSVGTALDNFIKEAGRSEEYKGVLTSKLYSTVYLNLSNYVHCKYPETMDLYGGLPGRFHVRGMRGTPKDNENIEILETYFTSVSQCVQLVILHLKLTELMSKDALLSEWMRFNFREK
jgi:hypothetical protein